MPAVVRAQLDYYAVLEIAPSADTAEVNAAFRRLAWRYHPDRNPAPGATVQFQDINEAHQVLSDPARRGEYDAKWHPKAGDQPRHAPTPARHYRTHRRWRRHRHLRAVLLGLGAMLFVSSAWAVIFTAMTAAHSGGYQLRLRFFGAVGRRRCSQLRLLHGNVPGHLRGRSRSRDNFMGNRGAQLLRRIDPHLRRSASPRRARPEDLRTIPKFAS